MKRVIVLLHTMALSVALTMNAQTTGREVLLDADWRFHLGSLAGAEQVDYDDSSWRLIDLPHDWSVEPVPANLEGVTFGPFSRLSERRYAGDALMGGGGWDVGHTLGGEGWYRKRFTLDKADKGLQIILYIEAASYQSEVWVNGQKAYFNHYAYTPFRIDITNLLNAVGKENIIAVKTVNEGHNSRWYVGSGLYRNVWLIKTSKTHIDKWETSLVTRYIGKREAVVDFFTHIQNPVEGTELHLSILSPAGEEVGYWQLPSTDGTLFRAALTIGNPQLWSPATPRRYKAVLQLRKGGVPLDEIRIDFGIRTVSVSASEGFKLNGESMLLKGCCIHHDNGLLGAAAIRRADEHRVQMLKENGFNAVRCSHNLPSESFLEACDRLGMMVIHETFDQWLMPKRPEDYHRSFAQHHEADLTAGIKRDRNHPCIVMWSIGNEIPGRITEEGMAVAADLRQIVRRLDDSRPIMAAICDWDWKGYPWEEQSAKAFRSLDVGGYNYLWRKYESDHKTYPDRVMMGSESFPKEAAENWRMVEKHPYVIGDFVWTAIDYVGEAGLAHTAELTEGEPNPQFMDWPWYNAWCGDLDLIGNKKPQAYFRNVLWGVSPVAMAVRPPVAEGKQEVVNGWGWTNERQSWTWHGMEGQTMTVRVFSRASRVSLTLNDKLLGTHQPDPESHTATFLVPYAPGRLVARNVGTADAPFVLHTAGEASALRLTADRPLIEASPHDLAYIDVAVTDSEGRVVPDAEVPLTVSCSGPATVTAGNGSCNDMQSFRSLTPKTFRGRALVIVRPTKQKGDITVTVTAAGIGSQKAIIKTK